jgi:hypothetical protein
VLTPSGDDFSALRIGSWANLSKSLLAARKVPSI